MVAVHGDADVAVGEVFEEGDLSAGGLEAVLVGGCGGCARGRVLALAEHGGFPSGLGPPPRWGLCAGAAACGGGGQWVRPQMTAKPPAAMVARMPRPFQKRSPITGLRGRSIRRICRRRVAGLVAAWACRSRRARSQAGSRGAAREVRVLGVEGAVEAYEGGLAGVGERLGARVVRGGLRVATIGHGHLSW